MKSANTDSAAFPSEGEWDQVDRPIVHRRVRGLQIRIAKATRDQDWRRVKALQRFLVMSTVSQYVQMTLPSTKNWRKYDRSTIDMSQSK